jgi:trehalose 6-phosphate synthase/phosphatase
VNDSDDIAELLATLTNSLDDGKGRIELLQFDAESSLGSSRSLAELARYGSMVNMSTNLSRQGSVVDVTAHRYGRNQSVSNFSDNSSLECGNKGDAQVKIALPNDLSASISAEACKVSLQS